MAFYQPGGQTKHDVNFGRNGGSMVHFVHLPKKRMLILTRLHVILIRVTTIHDKLGAGPHGHPAAL